MGFLLKKKSETDIDVELKPLTKERAISSLMKFRKNLGIEGLHPTEQRIRSILEKSGPLSEEVTKMRSKEP
jgi:hypothetical protein